MNKVNLLFSCLLLWMASITCALADTVAPYKVDFNKSIDTSDPAFAVAPGWDHYIEGVDNGYILSYPSYTWSATGGNNDTTESPSGWLEVGTQNKRDAYWQYVNDNDIIITPAVSGKVSFYAQYTTNYDFFFKVYTMKKVDGKWERDELLLDLNIDDDLQKTSRTFFKFEIKNVENRHLGFYMSDAGLDDFEAEQAEIPQVASVGLKKITPDTFGDYVDADENNIYTVNFQATIVNNGNVVLTPGMENYSLSVLDENENVIKTVSVEEELQVGESKDIDITVARSYDEFPNKDFWTLRSDLDGKTLVIGTINPGAYNAAPTLTPKLEGDVNTTEIDFGKTRYDVHQKYVLHNTSGRELNITSVTNPDGFKLNIETPAVINKHDSLDVDITLLAAEAGVKEGDLVISTNQGDLTVKLAGEVAPETTWAANFEDVDMPVGTICDKSAWSIEYKAGTWATENDTRNLKIAQYGSDKQPLNFITPLLEFAEGETFELDLARNSTYNSYKNYNFSVLYSTDRTNWTTAKTITYEELSPIVYSYTEFKFKHFVVDNIPAGQYYIAVAGINGKADNFVGGTPVKLDHDWMIASTKVPATGMVNNKAAISVTLLNNNLSDEPADAYKVFLCDNGTPVCEATTVDVPAGKEQEFSIAYTPHTTGTHELKVQLISTDKKCTLESEAYNIEVSAESVLLPVTVGTVAYGTDYAGLPKGYSEGTTPIYASARYSESEELLPASKLEGILKAGDKIGQLNLSGACGTDGYKAHITIWMDNTTDEAMSDPFVDADTTKMTLVYDGDTEFTRTYTGWSSADGPVATINFAFPFIYEGNGIRLRFVHKSEQECYDLKFERVADDEKLCYRKNSKLWSDGLDDYASQPLPVFHFGLMQEPLKVIGEVKDYSGNALPGVDITIKSDDVEYYATTDAEGKYLTEVLQSTLDYQATAKAAEYEDTTIDIDPSEANNFKMHMGQHFMAPGYTASIVAVYGDDDEDADASPLARLKAHAKAEGDAGEDEDEQLLDFYELGSYADGVATFNKVDPENVVEGNIYIVKAIPTDVVFDIDFSAMDNKADRALVNEQQVDGLTYTSPVYRTQLFSDENEKVLYYNQSIQAFCTAAKPFYTTPFEGVIKGSASLPNYIEVVFNETPSGIKNVNKVADDTKVYNIEGMKVSDKGTKGLKPGLYIMNGKKIVVK